MSASKSSLGSLKSFSFKNNELFIEIALLLTAWFFWLVCFRGYFLQQITLEGTAPAYYYRIKYFLDSMVSGVYPMWNPFSAWGGPELLDMRALGEFNPFLYLIIIFKTLGLPFYEAYLLYMASYYFVGCAGLYLLAKQIWNDRRLAYAAFLMFLFSSLGPAAFTENILVYLAVPAIWFFYFLFKLKKDNAVFCWLGVTLCSMIILTTYLPFYFVFIFLLFVVGNTVFNFRQTLSKCQDIFQSVWTHRWLALFCVLAVLCSAVPGVQWYVNAHSPDYLVNFKHRQTAGGEFLSVNQETISAGSISGIMDWTQLISGLNIFPGQETAVFYVSVLAYMLVFLTIFNKRTEKLSVLFFMGLSLFVLALADVSSVYRFLYQHVSVVRLIRNLFFFAYLLIPVFILFTVEQLRIFLSNFQARSAQKYQLIFIILMHGAMLAGLLHQDEIIVSTFVVWGGSLLFFMLLALDRLSWDSIVGVVLFMVLLLIQPAEVFYNWTHHAKKFDIAFRQDFQKPEFVFQRPSPDADAKISGAEGYAAELKLMKDRSGVVASEYIGLKNIYELQQKIDPAVLSDYARNKFVVYDGVRAIEREKFDFKELEKSLREKRNEAVVFTEDSSSPVPVAGNGQFSIIEQGDPHLKFLSYGLNSIKFQTSFETKKFLVYNDGFYKGWQAFVNGTPVRIWQANYAFKGVWLEPGENTVFLRYGSPQLYGAYVFLAVLMGGLLLTLSIIAGRQFLKDMKRS